MRNIFFSLLILNFAYLAYVVYSPVTPASVAAIPAVQPMPSGVGTLVLTTEIANGLERARQLNQVVNNPIYGEASDNVQCPALGPLTDLFAGQNLVETLKAQAFDVVFQLVDKPYWYISK